MLDFVINDRALLFLRKITTCIVMAELIQITMSERLERVTKSMLGGIWRGNES